MPKQRLLVLLLCLTACQSAVQVDPLKTLPTYQREELPPPIEEREKDKLPKQTGKPTAIKKDASAPFTGVLMDTYLVAKYKLIVAARDRWRQIVDAERLARAEVQQTYNSVLRSLYEQAKRSWWEDNKGVLGFVVGTIAASALAIGIAAGIKSVK